MTAELMRRSLLGGVAKFGVDDAVCGQVNHGLASNAGEVDRRLHDCRGVDKGLEVADQRSGVGVLCEVARQLDRVCRGELVPDLRGELNQGCWSEAAVEVVVKDNLGQGADLISGECHGH